jgi:hypothetical protein
MPVPPDALASTLALVGNEGALGTMAFPGSGNAIA